jgi:hypothetical protein
MLIYKIANDLNNKVYIGQTTQTLAGRTKNYLRDTKYAKVNRPIVNAMRKYGFERFKFEIIVDNIESKSKMDELEREYISKFNSCDSRFGYNVELGGNSVGKHAESTKKKISQAQLGEKNHMYGKSGKLNPRSISVIDITTGKIYGSAMEASRELNLEFSHICSNARGERGSTGNHIFRYIRGAFELIELVDSIVKVKSEVTKNLVKPEYRSVL